MNIQQMHVWFRQYAQQMGMQNIRAILPEQIDILINTSITDVVNQLIAQHIGNTNDRVLTDNTKLGQINAFSTLYRVKLIDMAGSKEERVFSFSASDRLVGKMTNSFKKISSVNSEDNVLQNCMFITDFSISYRKVADKLGYVGVDSDYVPPTFDINSPETRYFPVRLIDDAFLADTLNDFILKNRIRSPIIVTYNNGTYDLYIDEFKKVDLGNGQLRFVLDHDLIPYRLRVAYIAKPAKVKYVTDLEGDDSGNVDCDLPEYTHVDVVKHAVDLYRIAVSGSLHASSQQQSQGSNAGQQTEGARTA